METRDLLTDSFVRIHELYEALAADLDETMLHERPGGTGNPIGWLLWHAARVQDDHVADLGGVDQRWPRWQERVGVDLGVEDIGYGHTSADVDAVRIADQGVLASYQADVHAMTLDHLAGLEADALDRVVDHHWDPPVTHGARLVSVIGDCLQHLGQVGYVKGLLTA